MLTFIHISYSDFNDVVAHRCYHHAIHVDGSLQQMSKQAAAPKQLMVDQKNYAREGKGKRL